MNTRTALLDHAEDAVRARGYDGFSYADLAVLVGIRKASIHHHFPTKADLALALIERYSIKLFQSLAEIAALEPSGAGRVAAYVGTLRAALDDGRKLCLCVAFCGGRDSLTVPVLERLDAFHVTVAAWLCEAFTLGQGDGSIDGVVDPEESAHACLALVEGAQLIGRAAADVGRFDRAVADMLRRVHRR